MIESDTADAVAAIHSLEHLYYWDVEPTLLEWKRILKPGGKMIIELPSGDKLFSYMAACYNQKVPTMPFMSMLPMYGDPKHKDPLMCHHWLWFKKPLMDMLQKVGMREVVAMEPNYHYRCRDLRVECVK